MTVSVVVVAYSPGPALDEFLESLDAASGDKVEVVVADNGSPDGSVDRAAARGNVVVVDTGANLGYGRAANIGVAATYGEFVVVSNPDVIWQPGSLDELVAAAHRWPQAGAVGPLIVTSKGQVYPSARELPSLGRGIGHALAGWWWPSNPWTAAYRHERGIPTERPAGWLSGSCVLLRRAAFDDVGGFDAGYFMYFEDVDLGDRLGRAGWQNVYVPAAVVEHTGGHATERDRARMATEHHRSAWRYLSRRYSGARWLPVRAVIRCGLWARSVVARRSRRVADGAAPQRRADVR